jgi:hypothetical protein
VSKAHPSNVVTPNFVTRSLLVSRSTSPLSDADLTEATRRALSSDAIAEGNLRVLEKVQGGLPL